MSGHRSNLARALAVVAALIVVVSGTTYPVVAVSGPSHRSDAGPENRTGPYPGDRVNEAERSDGEPSTSAVDSGREGISNGERRGNTGHEPWFFYFQGVNTANGNLFVSKEDISIGARGGPLRIVRSYNSRLSDEHSPFGFGWTHNYNMKLIEKDNGSVAFFGADGSVHTFTRSGAGYEAPPGTHSRLAENGSGFVLRRQDGTELLFDSTGRLTRIVDKNGNHVHLGYVGGRLTTISDDSGQQLTLEYNAEGRITEIVDPLNRTIRYRYEAGDLAEVTGPMGASIRYSYYANHKLKRVVTRSNATRAFSYYSGSDRVKCIGTIASATFDSCSGARFTFDYDYGNDTVDIVDSLTGNATSVMLNDAGSPVRVRSPTPTRSRQFVWDADRNLLEMTNDSGTYTFEYDNYGNRIAETDPSNNTVRYGWRTVDTNDTYITLLMNRTDARGRTWEFRYDGRGNRIKVTNPLGHARRIGYDRFGFKVNETDFAGHLTRYVYDTHGFRTAVVDPSGRVRNFTYNAIGWKTSRTDGRNNTYRFEYNLRGDITKMIDPSGNETTLRYDIEGSLVNVTNAKGRTITAEFTGPTPGKLDVEVDDSGNLASLKVGNYSVNREFDASGRLTAVTVDYGSFNKTIDYSYDADGNLVKMETPGGTRQYEYDELGRLIRTESSNGTWVNYTYDAAGRRTKAVFSNGVVTTYEYDDAGHLLALRTEGPDGTAILNRSYTYDAAGNRVTVTDDGGDTIRYEYDELDRLVRVVRPSGRTVRYAYDAVGNRISRTVNGTRRTNYTYGSEDELLEAGSVTYAYDETGNRIEKRTADGVTRYGYGAGGRLTNVTLPDGDRTSFTYLPNGARASKTTPDGTTYYLYSTRASGWDVVAAFHANGSLKRQYLHGPRTDESLGLVRNGRAYFYHADERLNVQALTDRNGSVVNRYRYDAFGDIRRQTEAVANPYRFAGRRYDRRSGLYYNRMRYYDPAVGRFTRRDPAGLRGGVNPYTYAFNNPIKYHDPSGLDPWIYVGAGGGAGVALTFEWNRNVALKNEATNQRCEADIFVGRFGWVVQADLSVEGGAFTGPRCGESGLPGESKYYFAAFGWGEIAIQTNFRGVAASGSVGVGGTFGVGYMVQIYENVDCTCPGKHLCDCPACEGNPKCEDGQDQDVSRVSANPDDNHDLSILSYTRENPDFDYRQGARVAVFARGYSAELTDLLVELDEPPARVGLRTPQAELDRYDVLVVPTGGLFGLSSLPSFEAKLERYVERGGTLVVFPQQRGYEFEPVPGDLGGYGWAEDQECQYSSVGIADFCSIVASLGSETANVNVDGYFTEYPDNATVLLSRTKNGQPSMLTYGYGEGRVLATAAYTDWAAGHHADTRDGRELLRDVLTWAKRPDPDDVPVHAPGETASLSVNVTSYIDMTADRVQVRLISPDGSVTTATNVSTSISRLATENVSFTHRIPRTSRLGIWRMEYSLLNDSHGEVQRVDRAGHVAVAVFDESGEGWTFQGGNVSVSVTSTAERFPRGTNASFTVTVRNRGDTDRNVTVTGSHFHHSKSFRRTLTVPAGGQQSFVHRLPVTHQDWLRANLYEGNTTAGRHRIGSTQRGFFVFNPAVDVAVNTDRKRYSPGDDATVDLALESNAALNASFDVAVADPGNELVFHDRLNASLRRGEPLNASFNFTLPSEAEDGTYTVIVESFKRGRKVGFGSTHFQIPTTSLIASPDLPRTLRNDSSIAFEVTNVGNAPATNATFGVSLVDPAGAEAWNDSETFDLGAGNTTRFEFTMDVDTRSLGEYRLEYTADYRNKTRLVRSRAVPNTATVAVDLDRPFYRVRGGVGVNVTVANAGRFRQGDLRVETSVPDAGFSRSGTFTLNPGGNATVNYTVGLPANLAQGKHAITVVTSLENDTTGNATVRNLSFLVPESRLALSLADTSYDAGGTLGVNVTNVGGVDTVGNCSMAVYGPRGTLLGEEERRRSVRAGGSETLAFTIPEQATDGIYFLATTCDNANTNATARLTGSFDVSGLDAGLASTTNKGIYSAGENVTITTNITNSDGGIRNATLRLTVKDLSADGSTSTGATSAAVTNTRSIARYGNRSGTEEGSQNGGPNVSDFVGSPPPAPENRTNLTGRLGPSVPGNRTNLTGRLGPSVPGNRTDLTERFGLSIPRNRTNLTKPPDPATVRDRLRNRTTLTDRPMPPGLEEREEEDDRSRVTETEATGEVERRSTLAATNRTIESGTVWRDRRLVSNRSIVVNTTANLTLVNTTLAFDNSDGLEHGIEVRDGGELHVRSGSNVTALDADGELFFRVRSGATFEMRDSAVNHAGDCCGPLDEEGLYIAADNAVIENSSVKRGGRFGIVVHDADNATIVDANVSLTDEEVIHLRNSNFTRVVGNDLSSRDEAGVELRESNHVEVASNDISGEDARIELDYSNFNDITDNTLTGEYVDGIELDGSDSNNLTSNELSDGGIELGDSDANDIAGNNLSGSRWSEGINLWRSDATTVVDNTVSRSYIGIDIGSSRDVTVTGNTVTNSTYVGLWLDFATNATLRNNTVAESGFHVSGREFRYLDHDIDTSNTVQGGPLYYRMNRSNETVSGDVGAAWLINTTDVTVRNVSAVGLISTANATVENVTASDNLYGIYLFDADDSVVRDSQATNNAYGIALEARPGSSSNGSNTIIGNNASNNQNSNIFLASGSSIVRNNTASHSRWGGGIVVGGASNTTVVRNKAFGNSRPGISISSPNSSLTDNAIGNNSDVGIRMSGASSTTLEDNDVLDNSGEGISISWSDNVTLRDNNVSDNGYSSFRGGEGIRLSRSRSPAVIGNNLSSNFRGLSLFDSANATLRNNTMDHGFHVGGNVLRHFLHDIDTSNTVHDGPLYYLINRSDETVPGDAGAAWLINTTDATISDGHGVGLVSTDNVTIENVTLSNNRYGVYLLDSDDNIVRDSEATNNTHGIHLLDSDGNTVRSSEATNNTNSGIDLREALFDGTRSGSDNNTITGTAVSDNRRRNIVLDRSKSNNLTGIVASDSEWGAGIALRNADSTRLARSTVSGNGHQGIVVRRSDAVSLVNNDVVNNSDDGILMSGSKSARLEDNEITNNSRGGVLIGRSDLVDLTDNGVSDNSDTGIFLGSSSSGVLIGNDVSGSGVVLSRSTDATLRNNTLGEDFDVFGRQQLRHFLHDIDTSNTVGGTPIYYLVNRSDETVPETARSIWLVNTTDVAVQGGDDVSLIFTDNATVENVTASDERYGIYLLSSNHSTIRNSETTDNTYGVFLMGSSNNTLTDLEASDNIGGTHISGSDNTLADSKMTGNHRGVSVSRGSNNTLARVEATNNTIGIFLSDSSNNSLTGNNASGNRWTGISLRRSDDNDVTGERVSGNGIYGVFATDSRRNRITNSTIVDNGFAASFRQGAGIVFFDDASGDNLMFNNYIDNPGAANAIDRGNNTWNTTRRPGTTIVGGAFLGGNYWGDYAGADQDDDLIGDTRLPYTASGNITGGGDFLPLVRPERAGGGVIWSENVTVDVSSGGTRTVETEVPVDVLQGVTGKLKLSTAMTSTTNQTIASEDPPFYIVDGNTSLTLETDEQVYKPNESVAVSGNVTNNDNTTRQYTLSVKKNGTEIFTDTFDLGPGATHHYETTTTSGAPFTLQATAETDTEAVTVEDTVDVIEPAVNATLVAPDVVGRDAFDAGVLVENTAGIETSLDVSIENRSSWTVTLGPDESRLLETPTSIEENTTLAATITGDVNRTLERDVTFGEDARITVSPRPTYPEGQVAIPYTIENTGRLDTRFNATFTVDGRTVRRGVFLPTGNNVSGRLLVNLTAGEYTLAYASPFGENVTSFTVAERNQLSLEADVPATPTNDTLRANVTIRNVGPNDVHGTLIANSTALREQREFNVSAGETTALALTVALPGEMAAGRHPISFRAVTEGSVIAERTGAFEIMQPRFEVVAAPANRSFELGERASLNVTVENTGGAEGRATLNTTVPGIFQGEETAWIAPGNRTNLTVSFLVPDDLSEGTYPVEFSLGGSRTETSIFVRGAKVNVTAALDRQLYEEGENATLTLHVRNERDVDSELFSRVKFNNYDRAKNFSLGGGENRTLTFEVPVRFGGDEKIFYSVYADSGRSLYINGIRPHEQQPNVSLFTDQGVYDIGETATIQVESAGAGELKLSAPGLAWEGTVNGSETVNFTVPQLRSGTYFVFYEFANETHSYPFDVAGYHARISEAVLDKEAYVEGEGLALTLTFEASRAVPGTVTAEIRDAEGGVLDTSRTNVSLDAGENEVTLAGDLPMDVSGIHSVAYRITAATDPPIPLAAGTEFFRAHERPEAAFTFTPSDPSVGENVTFDATGSTDPDGSITAYGWDFDGDGSVDATGVTANRSFAAAGEHPVTLTVTDTDGASATVTRPVNVTAARTTCVDEAVAGGDRRISLAEIQQAINWWAEDTEVPDTGGETISLAKIQELINAWAEDATVSCETGR